MVLTPLQLAQLQQNNVARWKDSITPTGRSYKDVQMRLGIWLAQQNFFLPSPPNPPRSIPLPPQTYYMWQEYDGPSDKTLLAWTYEADPRLLLDSYVWYGGPLDEHVYPFLSYQRTSRKKLAGGKTLYDYITHLPEPREQLIVTRYDASTGYVATVDGNWLNWWIACTPDKASGLNYPLAPPAVRDFMARQPNNAIYHNPPYPDP